MRALNIFGMVLFGLVVLIVVPAITTGQPGGFGKKNKQGAGFPGGGPGGMMSDPNALFDYLAKGRQFFLITETRSLGGPLTQFSQERGINNGQITRQQFLDFQDWREKQRALGGGPGGGAFGGGGGPFGGGPFGGPGKKFDKGAQSPADDADALNKRAEEEFRRRDQNGDGKLTPEEASPPLRRDFARWDTNGDGVISLEEFKAYFKARSQMGEDRNAAAIINQEEGLGAKPVVSRVGAGGKMPAGLPPWFMELDTDKDGQVDMYEWRRANKPFDEFANWDLNGDGFITPEEALKQQMVIAKTTKSSQGAMAFGGEEGADNPFRKPGKNGPGGFPKGFGKGEGGMPFQFGGPGQYGGGGNGDQPPRFQFGQPRDGSDPNAERTKGKGGGKKKGGGGGGGN